jgi:hypothetical protein
MNKDIRLATGFFTHPKTVKLKKRCGLEGVFALQCLWMWSANNRPDGNLAGFDAEDIEIAATWEGAGGLFYQTLVDLKWLDVDGEEKTLHDWIENNPWVADSGNRSDKGRLNRLKGTLPEVHQYLLTLGMKCLSKKDYLLITKSDNPLSTAQVLLKQPLSTCLSPGPAPAPAPAPKERSKPSCSEPTASDPAIVEIILNTKAMHPITQLEIDNWCKLFPAVNVLQELRTMAAWSEANPQRRKTDKGVKRFVVGWLSKQQDKGGMPAVYKNSDELRIIQ